MSKKYLISFASPDLKSTRRYYDQSKEMNFYDDINVFSISDLEERHQKFIFDLLKNNIKMLWLLVLETINNKSIFRKNKRK